MSAAETNQQTGGAAPPVGTAPINWNNGDIAGWAPFVPFPQILDEMVAAGYGGTEYGAEFPAEAAPLRQALAAHGLTLSGSFRWLPLLDDAQLAADRPALEAQLRLLADVGGRNLIIAVAMTPERIALAGHVPSDGSAALTDEQWDQLGRNIAEVARIAHGYGVRPHFHNHVGTFVETPAEVERLLAVLDPSLVDLCFDTGHYAFGGGDPAAFVARHHDRIGYLHLKDVDPAVLARVRERGEGFLDALRQCVFSEFGQGMVDIPGIVQTLRDSGYNGWIVVEQDTSSRPATESARASRDYLRDNCGI